MGVLLKTRSSENTIKSLKLSLIDILMFHEKFANFTISKYFTVPLNLERLQTILPTK